MRSTLLVLLALAAGPSAPSPAAAPHDLHLTSGNAVVEGDLVLTRIRFFKDDLEAALRLAGAPPDFVLSNSLRVDSIFLDYLRERYVIRVGDEALDPVIVAKGEDELDREPVWWYAIQHQAPGPIGVFRARNTLLLELFRDQRNVLKFVRFPDETQKTFSFGAGDEEFEVRL